MGPKSCSATDVDQVAFDIAQLPRASAREHCIAHATQFGGGPLALEDGVVDEHLGADMAAMLEDVLSGDSHIDAEDLYEFYQLLAADALAEDPELALDAVALGLVEP